MENYPNNLERVTMLKRTRKTTLEQFNLSIRDVCQAKLDKSAIERLINAKIGAEEKIR
jgi:hypothetical protein